MRLITNIIGILFVHLKQSSAQTAITDDFQYQWACVDDNVKTAITVWQTKNAGADEATNKEYMKSIAKTESNCKPEKISKTAADKTLDEYWEYIIKMAYFDSEMLEVAEKNSDVLDTPAKMDAWKQLQKELLIQAKLYFFPGKNGDATVTVNQLRFFLGLLKEFHAKSFALKCYCKDNDCGKYSTTAQCLAFKGKMDEIIREFQKIGLFRLETLARDEYLEKYLGGLVITDVHYVGKEGYQCKATKDCMDGYCCATSKRVSTINSANFCAKNDSPKQSMYDAGKKIQTFKLWKYLFDTKLDANLFNFYLQESVSWFSIKNAQTEPIMTSKPTGEETLKAATDLIESLAIVNEGKKREFNIQCLVQNATGLDVVIKTVSALFILVNYI